MACCCRNGLLLVGFYDYFSFHTKMDCQTCALSFVIFHFRYWCTCCFMVFLINVKSSQRKFRMENRSGWWCYCLHNYFLLCFVCMLLMEKYKNRSLNFRSCWRFFKPHYSSCLLPYHFLHLHVPNYCLVGINHFLLIQYGWTTIRKRMVDCVHVIRL